MCLSKVYIDDNGKKKLLAEEVASVEVKGNQVLLKNLFVEEKKVEASIKKIDFLTHDIVLGN